MIPFKCNTSTAKGGLWEKMLLYFNLHNEEFIARYHLRSNVEGTFSMCKAKFGDSLRSKTDVAMKMRHWRNSFATTSAASFRPCTS